jgi:hypothetical protein
MGAPRPSQDDLRTAVGRALAQRREVSEPRPVALAAVNVLLLRQGRRAMHDELRQALLGDASIERRECG